MFIYLITFYDLDKKELKNCYCFEFVSADIVIKRITLSKKYKFIDCVFDRFLDIF